MSKTVTVTLTEEELKFLLGALDRAPFQGLGTARTVAVVAEKLVLAMKPAEPRNGNGRRVEVEAEEVVR